VRLSPGQQAGEPVTQSCPAATVEPRRSEAFLVQKCEVLRHGGTPVCSRWNFTEQATRRDQRKRATPVGTPWMWTLTFGHHEHRTRTHGYAATREAAIVAFAKSWRRERLSAIAAVLDYEEFVHWSKEASSLRYAFVYWSSPRKKLSCYWIFVLRPDLIPAPRLARWT
jgi:hypothetical protein